MNQQITSTYHQTARFLKAIAHPVRLAILDILINNQEECVCHLEAMLGYRQSYLSQHLMSLREMGIVVDRRDGRNIFYSISSPQILEFLKQAVDLINPGTKKNNFNKTIICTCPKCSEKEIVNNF